MGKGKGLEKKGKEICEGVAVRVWWQRPAGIYTGPSSFTLGAATKGSPLWRSAAGRLETEALTWSTAAFSSPGGCPRTVLDQTVAFSSVPLKFMEHVTSPRSHATTIPAPSHTWRRGGRLLIETRKWARSDKRLSTHHWRTPPHSVQSISVKLH